MRLKTIGRCQQQRRRPIIDARRIASGHGHAVTINPLEGGKLFGFGAGARMLVSINDHRITTALWDHNRGDFIGKFCGGMRGRPALL